VIIAHAILRCQLQIKVGLLASVNSWQRSYSNMSSSAVAVHNVMLITLMRLHHFPALPAVLKVTAAAPDQQRSSTACFQHDGGGVSTAAAAAAKAGAAWR
jgi:hypothetical protein